MNKLTQKDVEFLIKQQYLEKQQERDLQAWLGQARNFLSVENLDTFYAIRQCIKAEAFTLNNQDRRIFASYLVKARNNKKITHKETLGIFKLYKKCKREQATL